MRVSSLSSNCVTNLSLKQSKAAKYQECIGTLTKTYVKNITLIYNTDMKRK